MGWRGTILEDMSQMASAGGAIDFRADHAKALVRRGINGSFDRIVEARPSRPAFEFSLRFEQGLTTANA